MLVNVVSMSKAYAECYQPGQRNHWQSGKGSIAMRMGLNGGRQDGFGSHRPLPSSRYQGIAYQDVLGSYKLPDAQHACFAKCKDGEHLAV